jgi:hydroxyacylglutathione hydrolase
MKLTGNLYFYPEQGMLDCNTYIIAGKPGLIIDPGNPGCVMAKVNSMRRDGIEPGNIGTIINTHLHIDHCSGNASFKQLSGAKIILHKVQQENYQSIIGNDRMLGMEPEEFTADEVVEGEQLSAGGIELEMIPAPGHSPECVCFYEKKNKWLLCGDVIFEMNTGRVDLPGGDADQLKISIESLSRLDIEYLLPGHMGPVMPKAKVVQNFEFIRTNVFQWL